jgi:serine/threonine protein kinase
MNDLLAAMDRMLRRPIRSWTEFLQIALEWIDLASVPLIGPHELQFDSTGLILGTGAFSSVHSATLSSNAVAVKKYNNHHQRSGKHLSVFCTGALRELMFLQMFGLFRSPGYDHVVHLHGVCVLADEIWLVIERLNSSAGGLMMRSESLGIRGGVFHQVASALAHTHRIGAHGDVKRENLLFRDEETIVLIDYNGALPIAAQGRDVVAQVGGVVGTHGYMALEHVRGSSRGIGFGCCADFFVDECVAWRVARIDHRYRYVRLRRGGG